MAITYNRANELLRYDPDTGDLVRKVTRSHNAVEGDVAGSPDKMGYIQIQIDGKLYKAHRLAWLLQTGELPSAHIDHADGISSNNRWANLRLATPSQNLRNARLRSDNKSGFKGVCRYKGRWLAQIQTNGKCRHLGMFDNPEDAHAAYMKAAIADEPNFVRAS